ncbi:hypothetical protein U9M48_016347 [Paspalum notatum var. saurae]|uniref:Kinetochore protein SPC25 n=1 Tax=Paspalum notatum var. saurae TaxID=547442 RepID=A0AAQ3T8I6_PASNO
MAAQLNEQKQQLRKLAADLAQALSVQTSKRSKHRLMSESVSNASATNEQLRNLVVDQRARRDEYLKAISNEIKAIESHEAETDAKGDKSRETAIMWYKKFLGFQVVGGEGVKFVFNKIDVQSPDKEYSFCIKLVKERYILIQCVPIVDGSEELVKDLNCNNDLYKFVRVMRERFQAATISGNILASSLCPDMSSIASSSLSALSLDSRSDNSTNPSDIQHRSKNQEIPTKKGPVSRSATSSPSPMLCTVRCSPRIIVSTSIILPVYS